MLSRIARGLYGIGRSIERAQNVIRVLEVNHKMNLERDRESEQSIWLAIAEAFHTQSDPPSESILYQELVLSFDHPHAVRACIRSARDQGRAMRDHISEEMWLHLNGTYLSLSELTFADILREGRSEFNRRIETFCDAFHGLADDTMIHGPAWRFLRIGKFLERASMICRILDIKRKVLALAPDDEGRPIDVHQWQALLRSLSGYEPYRRAYDARIMPSRVLEFVLQRADFPRSLGHAVQQVAKELRGLNSDRAAQIELHQAVEVFVEQLRMLDAHELLRSGSLESHVPLLSRRCEEISSRMEASFFVSVRPASAPILPIPHAGLVPQQ